MPNLVIIPPKKKSGFEGFHNPMYFGYDFQADCPECGATAVREDPEFEEVNYNAPEMVGFYCEECDEDWNEFVILEVTIKAESEG